MNTTLTTAPITAPANQRVWAAFSNGYRGYDEQIGEFRVSVDGGSFDPIATWTFESIINSSDAYEFPSSASDRDFVFQFELFATEASGGNLIFVTGAFGSLNDWYWAIDNVCLLIDADPLNAVDVDWRIYE